MAQPPRFSPGTGSCYMQATRNLIATENRRTNHTSTVIDTNSGQSLEYYHLMCVTDKDIWKTSLANNLVRLAQGVGTRMPTGTNTVFLYPAPQSLPDAQSPTHDLLPASDPTRPKRIASASPSAETGWTYLVIPQLTASA